MNRRIWWVGLCAVLAWPAAASAQTTAAVTLTLEEAIARGLGASHLLDEADARVEAGEASLAQRNAALLPRLNAQAGYQRTNHIDPFGIQLPDNQLRVIYPDIPDNYRTRLDAQWPVYTGGRLQALQAAARTDASALAHDRQSLRSTLRVEIARAYWSTVSASESVAVLDRAIERVTAHLRDARNRLEAGVASPDEVPTVEAQLARQRMLRIQAESNRDVARASLARLTGLPLDTPIEPTSPLDSGPARRDDDLGALVSAARARRADRQALDERVSAATQRQEAAAAGRRPTVGVTAGVDYARPNPRIFPRQGSWRESWDAGIAVDWPLFDGGRARAELAEATAARRAAQARRAEFDTTLALEIRRRLNELASNRAAVDAAEAAVGAATEAHRVVSERFAAGVATSTDVLDAQLTILQAGLDRTQAAAAVRIAEAELDRAIGAPEP